MTRRRWLLRGLAALVVPALVLLLIESALRIGGYGHPTSFFLRWTSSGREILVENTWFGLRFFPPALARSPSPAVVRTPKDPEVYRIFLFGESAALGDPRPAYGPGRYLEILLEERFPERRFEVVCVAMTAINSHAILPIARECAGLQGDLWVVYAGHNEMAGPFGATTVFGAQAPPRPLVRTYLALQRTRLGQLLATLLRKLDRQGAQPSSWGGMKMFLDQQLPPDHPGRARVYSHFQRNLEELVQSARRAGVPVLLSGVASNLKDCAPFASAPLRPGSSQEDQGAGGAAKEGERLAQQGRWADAAAQYRLALERDPESAELQFRRGASLLAAGEVVPARECFVRARDLDTLPFRADSRINGIISETARRFAGPGVLYVDPEAALVQGHTVPIPGEEMFYEHVHLNPDGNYRLALAWAEAIALLVPDLSAAGRPGAWAGPELCAQRLGLTDWNRLAALEEMQRRVLDAPFAGQLNQPARLEHFRREIAGTRTRMRSQTPAEVRAFYEAAIKRRPGDHWLHHGYAEYLSSGSDLAAATVQMERVRDLVPHDFTSHLQLGRLLARQGKSDEARRSLAEALRLRPDLSDARFELGLIAVREDKLDEALTHFDAVIGSRPGNAAAYLRRADVLMALNRREAAVQSLRDAILVQPSSWEARYFLGVELAGDGKVAEAHAQLAEVVRLRPDYIPGRLRLGDVLAHQERFDEALTQFREVLRLDPGNETARESAAALTESTFREGAP